MARGADNIPLDAPKELDKALTQLEEKMGGREKITASLAVVSGMSVEEQTVFNLMTDPANKGRSLAWLCGAAGTTVGRVLELFGKGDFAAAYVESIRRVNALLPQVAEDVMTRALPKWKSCRGCGATGHLPALKEGEDPRVCLDCEGLGRVETEPDTERQKVALQIGGLLKTGGGINIDNSDKRTQIAGPLVMVKSSPDFRTATDKLLYPGRTKELTTGTSEKLPSSEPVVIEAEKVVTKVVQPED